MDLSSPPTIPLLPNPPSAKTGAATAPGAATVTRPTAPAAPYIVALPGFSRAHAAPSAASPLALSAVDAKSVGRSAVADAKPALALCQPSM